ncbi:hypothetical protein CSA56_03665 [candidate division KSB3 bacterium]|uniref:Probable membrane transporter protein n=1 Tax=candidate division KSB3 bacterium TaxID=2044937 RepID=A0A2G6KL93_9BACT|nr:MAG: hypothetical protein CSA56_03665 [candidate division KSB3 bacterium]
MTTLFIGGFIISIFIGFLTGVFGVGGGFLMTPAMMILLGVLGPTAVGTSLATILCTSSFGLFKRRGTGTIDVKIVVFMAFGSLIGVWIGGRLLEYLKCLPPMIINGHEVVTVQYVLLWVFIGILLWTAGFMSFDYRRSRHKDLQPQVGFIAKIPFPPYGQFRSLEQPDLAIIPLILLGLIVGIFTGLMGIGGGVILLPALIYLVGQPTAKAAGTSLLLVWISSLMGVYLNAINGNIDVALWLSMVLGGLIGTLWGTKIGLKVDGLNLRLYFVYVILAAIAMIAFKLFQVTCS